MDGGVAVPRRRWVTAWKWLRPLLGMGLFAGVLALAWGELRALDWPQIHAEILQTDRGLLALSLVVVGANLAAMGLYDAACFPRRAGLGFGAKWGIGSLCFAWSNFLTLGPIGGPALRMLVYTRKGLTAAEVARGLGVQYIGFTSALAAWVVAMSMPMPAGGGSLAMRVVMAGVLAPVLSVSLRGASVWLLGRFGKTGATRAALRDAPAARIGLVGFLDWGCSLASFWLIASAAGVRLDPFETARAFFGGHIVGMASMLPGGLGSADAVWLIALTDAGHAPDESAAVILLFRLLFYIVPWGVAVVATVALASRGGAELKWRPQAVAAAQVVGSAFILVTAATPSLRDEIAERRREVALWVVEASHAVSVVSGALLVLMAVRLMRRSSRAYVWSAALLIACTMAHLVKHGDPQESVVGALMLGLLLLARRDFADHGLGALPGARATAGTMLGALAVYLGVGLTTAVRVRWEWATLTRVGYDAEFARLLRGGVALVVAAVLVSGAAWWRMKRSPQEPTELTEK